MSLSPKINVALRPQQRSSLQYGSETEQLTSDQRAETCECAVLSHNGKSITPSLLKFRDRRRAKGGQIIRASGRHGLGRNSVFR